LERVHYEGENVYFNVKTYLFGVRGGDHSQIQAGTHRYNFEYQLPPLLPASFEASKGYIRYNIEACLDIPWKFDKETKLQFTVVRNDDLNEFPGLRTPCSIKEIDRAICCFPMSHPLAVTVSIPCGGFTPGQTIPVKIHCEKISDIQVTGIKFCLRRVIAYNR
jgi:Arrestin (or S-antigen), N-terminal domain/Arrestin (or S-antigen), C-terminal domain